MMKCTIYLETNDVNDATSHYLNIIEQAFIKKKYQIEKVNNVKGIQNSEIVVVLHIKAFFEVWKRNFRQKIVIWFQGIIPEEIRIHMASPYKYIPRMIKWGILEYWALKNAYLSLFVSDSMLNHYRKKYNYKSSSYFIMPCFNLAINKSTFIESRYRKPNFVYAGGLAKWQCIDEMLFIYSKIEDVLDNAHLTILTGEQNEAKEKIKKYKIKNFEIKYVSLNELDKELSKYKYGFLLRKNIKVNQVATPTKMNSYLAAGVIPIYSDVIGDFYKVLENNEFTIKVNDFDVDSILNKVVIMEMKIISTDDIFENYSKIFDTYYNEKRYIKKLSEFL